MISASRTNSTFLTIPFEEIENFLNHHQLWIPSISEAAYLEVWNYLLDHEGLFVSSIYLRDFIQAYNLQGQPEIEVLPKYTTSFILLSPEKELRELATSLGLSIIDRGRIARILGYLDLLDNDFSVFDNLPEELLRFIASKLDCQSLGWFCEISQRFNLLFCQTGQLTEMLRHKLEETTRFDLTSFSRRELGNLCRMKKSPSPISARGGHSLCLDSRGQVFSFGPNEFGQLGLGRNDDISIPMMIEDPQNVLGKIVTISAGEVNSLLLNSQGQVFTFGNDEFGQLGIEEDIEEANIPILLETIKDIFIVDISCSSSLSLLLSAQGQVFGMGYNYCGILGLGEDSEEQINIPTLMLTDHVGLVVAISAGHDHSLILNSSGQVFSCGANNLGQLGLGHNYNQNVPTLIEAPKMGEIIAISAGGHHSLFLNAQGQVFACGSNNYGQLGFGNVKDRNFPKLIETFHADNKKVYQIPIVAISAGVQHSLLLDSYGQVWSFGRGDNGQLGLESKKETHTPTSITRLVMGEEIPVPFIAISAGDSHSLISDSQGRVFSLGESNDG